MIFGGIYETGSTSDFAADNVGITPLVLKSSTATQFQFSAGGLDFHSNTQQWLLVNQGGENAMFKCTGTVNGALAPDSEPFDCIIWAGDNEIGDTFRIKIFWEDPKDPKVGERVVYDNGAHQPIDGGSIIIHKNK